MIESKPSGWLLIDKPSGWTSFDVVNKVRATLAHSIGLKPKSLKVGHTGTLDPLATGLLLIAVGSTTKQIESQMKSDKTYETEMVLGVTSTTGDAEGELTEVKTKKFSQEEVEKALQSFVGEIEQIPPKFSALKVDGVAAYKRARAGEEFELKSRKTTIHSLDLISYDFPRVEFSTRVSSGTYIRSLVEDVGEKLGTGAYMSVLKRTNIASIGLESAISVIDVSAEQLNNALKPSLE